MLPALPNAITRAICSVIGGEGRFSPLLGGTNQRTFLVQRKQQYWVLRAEPAPAHSLLRAVAAQDLAHQHGVRVPVTLAHDQTQTDAGLWVWSVEIFADGVAFDTTLGAGSIAIAAAHDLGEQLRRLHTIEVDAFGDLPPRPYPVYPSARAWVQNKQRRVTTAVTLIGETSAMASKIERIYTQLAAWYVGSPRLCKGDCASTNLLVDRAQHVTLIDWEWAQGLDPAADLAYWCHFTPQHELHEALLAAYQPDDLPLFRRRMLAYRVLHSIELIHVYTEHQGAFSAAERSAGLRTQAQALHTLLSDLLSFDY